MADVERYKIGGIWWYSPQTREQLDKTKAERGTIAGKRPVMIISIVANPTSTCTITYLPISHAESATAKGRNADYFQVPIQIPGRYSQTSFVCCNQITTGVTNHFCGYIGQASDEMIDKCHRAVQMYLGIIPKDDSIFQRVQEHIDTENLDDYDFPEASASSKKDDSEELKTRSSKTFRNPRPAFEDDAEDDIVVTDGSVKLPVSAATLEPKKRRKGSAIYMCMETGNTYKGLKSVANFLGCTSTTAAKYIDNNKKYKGQYTFITYRA